MGGTLRARFTNGVFEPLEKVELPEGEEVTLIRNIYADRRIMTRPEPKL